MKTNIEHKSVDLCDSCQYCMKTSGYGREIKFCRGASFGPGGADGVVSFPVEKCSQFEMKGTLSKYEMESMAIYIEKKKDAPGFKFFKHLNGHEIEVK